MYEVGVTFSSSSKEYYFVMEKIPCELEGKKFIIENENGYDYRKSQVKIRGINNPKSCDGLKRIVKITDVETGIQYDCRKDSPMQFVGYGSVDGASIKYDIIPSRWCDVNPCIDMTNTTETEISFSKNAKLSFGSVQTTAAEVGENLKKLGELLKENEKENIKEKKNMFNFEFGRAAGVCMSIYGVAFKTEGSNDEGVAYKDGGWVEVPKQFLLNNPSLRDMLYVMPVAKKDVKVNDFIKHNNHWCRVAEVTDTTLKVEDVYTKTIVEILPTRSPFGFDFYSKLVNFFDGFGFGAAAASEENPFGNIGMMMMLADGDMGDNLLPLMMMNGGKMDMSNPMMMYFLLKK